MGRKKDFSLKKGKVSVLYRVARYLAGPANVCIYDAHMWYNIRYFKNFSVGKKGRWWITEKPNNSRPYSRNERPHEGEREIDEDGVRPMGCGGFKTLLGGSIKKKEEKKDEISVHMVGIIIIIMGMCSAHTELMPCMCMPHLATYLFSFFTLLHLFPIFVFFRSFDHFFSLYLFLGPVLLSSSPLMTPSPRFLPIYGLKAVRWSHVTLHIPIPISSFHRQNTFMSPGAPKKGVRLKSF